MTNDFGEVGEVGAQPEAQWQSLTPVTLPKAEEPREHNLLPDGSSLDKSTRCGARSQVRMARSTQSRRIKANKSDNRVYIYTYMYMYMYIWFLHKYCLLAAANLRPSLQFLACLTCNAPKTLIERLN